MTKTAILHFGLHRYSCSIGGGSPVRVSLGFRGDGSAETSKRSADMRKIVCVRKAFGRDFISLLCESPECAAVALSKA